MRFFVVFVHLLFVHSIRISYPAARHTTISLSFLRISRGLRVSGYHNHLPFIATIQDLADVLAGFSLDLGLGDVLDVWHLDQLHVAADLGIVRLSEVDHAATIGLDVVQADVGGTIIHLDAHFMFWLGRIERIKQIYFRSMKILYWFLITVANVYVIIDVRTAA